MGTPKGLGCIWFTTADGGRLECCEFSRMGEMGSSHMQTATRTHVDPQAEDQLVLDRVPVSPSSAALTLL